MKYNRIPFNIDLAKAITNGEKEGKVVTKDGVPVIIYDFNFDQYKTIAGKIERPYNYTLCKWNEDGVCSSVCDSLKLEVPNELEFKDGDIVAEDCECGKCVFIFSHCENENIYHHACAIPNVPVFLYGHIEHNTDKLHLADDEETNILIKALWRDNSEKTNELLKKFFSIKAKPEFNPFDEILVRNSEDSWWQPSFYYKSFLNATGEEMIFKDINGKEWRHCIPYNEETKHLLDRIDKWED